MNKKEAIIELVKYDHSFLTPEFARKVGNAFDIAHKVPVYQAKDTRSQFKGLTLKNAQEGEKGFGISADELAEWLCRELKVEYRHMYGRGSRLRECCRALLENLKQE